MKKKNFLWARIIGFIIGLLTLLWQVMQIAQGNFQNLFFIPDIMLGAALISASLVRTNRNGVLYLLLAYAFSVGVFGTATFGGLLTGTYDFGAFTTTVALVPCIIFIVLLSKETIKKPQSV